MRCHEVSCFVMLRRASGPVAPRPYPACRSSITFRSLPFRSPAGRLPARRDPDSRVSRAPAPARPRARFAAARFARLIAPAREGQTQDTPTPSASQGVSAPARTEAASGRRLDPPHIGINVPQCKHEIGNISNLTNKPARQLLTGGRNNGLHRPFRKPPIAPRLRRRGFEGLPCRLARGGADAVRLVHRLCRPALDRLWRRKVRFHLPGAIRSLYLVAEFGNLVVRPQPAENAAPAATKREGNDMSWQHLLRCARQLAVRSES